MYNWSTDEKELKKNPEQHMIWQLEQMINFGLNGKKLNETLLKKYWAKLSLDPARRRLLSLLMYGQLHSDRHTD